MHTQTTRNPPQTYAVAVKEREASLQAALGETLHLHKLGARLQTPAKECYSGTACSTTLTRLLQPKLALCNHLTIDKFWLIFSGGRLWPTLNYRGQF